MLADPLLEAVIIATSDAFHVPLATKVLGRQTFFRLRSRSVSTSRNVNSSVRSPANRAWLFKWDSIAASIPPLAFAARFIQEEMGPPVVLNAWYCDSVSLHDDGQPASDSSPQRQRPQTGRGPKSDKRRYFLLTHGSHLFDSARFLGGPSRPFGPASGSRPGASSGPSRRFCERAVSAISRSFRAGPRRF